MEDVNDPINIIKLTRGDFLIIRPDPQKVRMKKNMFYVIAKYSNEFRWPITNGVYIVKIFELWYSFSIEVPLSEFDGDNISETLNCVCLFKEEEELSPLKLLDEDLEKYAFFSIYTYRVNSKVNGNDGDYTIELARAILLEEKKIVSGLKFFSSATPICLTFTTMQNPFWCENVCGVGVAKKVSE